MSVFIPAEGSSDMTDKSNDIRFVEPSDEVLIHLPDGRVLSGKRGTELEAFMQRLENWRDPLVVGAIVNRELRELSFKIWRESDVTPVTLKDTDGARIYRRSLVFLLETAFEEQFPDVHLTVDHSVVSGGYFCQVRGREPLTLEELKRLKQRMKELVRQDLRFERFVISKQEAIELFEQQNKSDKVRLLKYRPKDQLVLYSLGHHKDYHHGYMVPSTGYLQWFDLKAQPGGFVLQFPRRHSPDVLLPMPEHSKLLQSFRQYGSWLERLGIDHVGALNEVIKTGRIQDVILVAEALHEHQVAEIAEQILNRRDQVRIVLLAGPSSSGKTTTAKRIAVQMISQGIEPVPIEMDNYFLDREKTPRDEHGNLDFEVLEALDTVRLNQDLKRLIAGEEVQLPKFDFREGRSYPGDVVKLRQDQMVILEGIHGLNPRLLPEIPAEQTFRVYVSCLTQLNLDRYNRISTTDTRLLRRIVRDERERGYSAQDTIGRWESVRRGEKRHIFPYQENADVMFNTALVYELAALKPRVEPLLRQVPFGTPEYIEAKRLLAFLDWILPIDEVYVPDNSILREFIGGSILKDFKLWTRVSD